MHDLMVSLLARALKYILIGAVVLYFVDWRRNKASDWRAIPGWEASMSANTWPLL